MFLFYEISFFKKDNPIQGRTLFKEIQYVCKECFYLFLTGNCNTLYKVLTIEVVKLSFSEKATKMCAIVLMVLTFTK